MTSKTSFPKEKIRILLLEGIHTNAVDVFQKAGYTNVERLTGALPADELAEKIKDVHMVGVRSRSQIKGAVLDAAEKLMSIGVSGRGAQSVLLPPSNPSTQLAVVTVPAGTMSTVKRRNCACPTQPVQVLEREALPLRVLNCPIAE